MIFPRRFQVHLLGRQCRLVFFGNCGAKSQNVAIMLEGQVEAMGIHISEVKFLETTHFSKNGARSNFLKTLVQFVFALVEKNRSKLSL